VGSASVEALAAEGHEAVERGDAAAARRAFEAALAERESGELLEGLARALYLEGAYPASLKTHERAVAAYRAEGAAGRAARAARIASWLHVNLHGDFAVAAGWLARAERLLEESGEQGAERGWVELVRASREPYGEARERRLRGALEIGREARDPDLEFAALALVGETLVLGGRIEEGMLAFDEALAAICAGEVRDLYVVEAVFCGMFLTCERVHDVVRAEQWLRAADDLIRRRGPAPVGPLCRAHYGGILMAAGRWHEAEATLDEAVQLFSRGYASARVIVLVRLADLRVRQGRLEEAAVLLEGLDQLPDAARPLAALHLAQGETALAREVLSRRLAAPALPAPWPIAVASPAPPPVAAPLLALLVDVCLAEADIDAAADAAERLVRLAGTYESPTSERARRSPEARCASPPARRRPSPVSGRHWPPSHSPGCRSSSPERGSSSPGRSRTNGPGSRSPRRRQPWTPSSAARRRAMPTGPPRSCARSALPDGAGRGAGRR
jgi:tetratricopeptide (TPR) repeat protein